MVRVKENYEMEYDNDDDMFTFRARDTGGEDARREPERYLRPRPAELLLQRLHVEAVRPRREQLLGEQPVDAAVGGEHAQLGVAEPEIQQSGSEQINVALPDVSNLQDAIRQVGTVAQMAFYDWEPNVLNENPNQPTISLYQAVLRRANAVLCLSIIWAPASPSSSDGG